MYGEEQSSGIFKCFDLPFLKGMRHTMRHRCLRT